MNVSIGSKGQCALALSCYEHASKWSRIRLLRSTKYFHGTFTYATRVLRFSTNRGSGKVFTPLSRAS